MNAVPGARFPGTLYDGDGTRLAGDGPKFTPDLADALLHKALIRDTPGDMDVAVLEAGDRLWLLPDSFGIPPEMPVPLLADLANVVRGGRKVGLAGSNQNATCSCATRSCCCSTRAAGGRERERLDRQRNPRRADQAHGDRDHAGHLLQRGHRAERRRHGLDVRAGLGAACSCKYLPVSDHQSLDGTYTPVCGSRRICSAPLSLPRIAARI